MTNQQATPTQEATPEQLARQVPNEAGFSVNMFLKNEVMGRLQFTFRGATSDEWGIVLADVDRFAHYMREKGWKFDGELPAQTIPQSEPVRVPVDDGGNEQPSVKVATAGRLSIEMKDGKYFYKVADAIFAQGERGTKYGIAVYPEVLSAAQLDVREGQPVPNIAGWRVDYILNEKGYPWKVTRLLPPK